MRYVLYDEGGGPFWISSYLSTQQRPRRPCYFYTFQAFSLLIHSADKNTLTAKNWYSLGEPPWHGDAAAPMHFSAKLWDLSREHIPSFLVIWLFASVSQSGGSPSSSAAAAGNWERGNSIKGSFWPCLCVLALSRGNLIEESSRPRVSKNHKKGTSIENRIKVDYDSLWSTNDSRHRLRQKNRFYLSA